ncbi:MAG: hypothetical protein AAGC46_11990 [Solirubrobacteraceae bacterium]
MKPRDVDELAREAYASALRGEPVAPQVAAADLVDPLPEPRDFARLDGAAPSEAPQLPGIPGASHRAASALPRAADEPVWLRPRPATRRATGASWMPRSRGGRPRRPLTHTQLTQRTALAIPFVTVLFRPWEALGAHAPANAALGLVIWAVFVVGMVVTVPLYLWASRDPKTRLGALWVLLTGASKRQPLGYKGPAVFAVGMTFYPVRIAVGLAGFHGDAGNQIAVGIVVLVALAYGFRPARLRAFRQAWAAAGPRPALDTKPLR